MKLSEFAKGVSVWQSTKTHEKPGWDDPGFKWHSWCVELCFEDRYYLMSYFTWSGCKGRPKLLDILYCLHGDCAHVSGNTTFEEWCSEIGEDTDSRRAERVFRACVEQCRKLKIFFGDKFEEFLECDNDI